MNPSIGRARLPIGKFVLRTTAPIKKIHLRLSLWNAELTGSILTDKGEIKLQTFVPATKDVIILTTSGEEKLSSVEWNLEPALSPFLSLGRDSISKYGSNPAATFTKENGINFHYQPLLVGGGYTTAWKQVRAGNQQTYFITIANSYPANTSRQLTKQTLSPLVARDVNTLTASHRNYWHRFYQKSFISIPDKKLESFWWIQQYKMASATRVGAYPIDLMGPWYRTTPWPKYWWNLNIQLTYYPFFLLIISTWQGRC